jgi:hypothetical protein
MSAQKLLEQVEVSRGLTPAGEACIGWVTALIGRLEAGE